MGSHRRTSRSTSDTGSSSDRSEASGEWGARLTPRFFLLLSSWPTTRGTQLRTEGTDEEIDALVYELYGLTEEEIAIVEQARG